MNILQETLILVTGPAISIYSNEHLKRVGVPTTIDMEGNTLDNGLNEPITAKLPIDRIAEIVTNGYPINIVNENDIVTIYKLTKKFVDEHSRINGIGLYKIVDDDYLEMLQEFLNYLQTNNRRVLEHYSKQEEGYSMRSRLFNVNTKPREEVDMSDIQIVNKSAIGLR